MDHAKKLDFIHKMTKLGLQHFDAGGMAEPMAPVQRQPTNFAPRFGGPGQSTMPVGTPGNTVSNTPNTNVNPISNMFGLSNNYTPGVANLQPGTNQSQLQGAYTGAQGALSTQGQVAGALAPQAQAAAANNAALQKQLQDIMAGQGPNPAQTMLNTATGNNVTSQAALAASQRGAAANPGLVARNAALAGTNAQQQAIGQGATLQAQQQIAAGQQLQNLAATEAGQALAGTGAGVQGQIGEQGVLQGANTAYNNANAQMQANINNVNAQTAAANQGLLGGLVNSAGTIGTLYGLGAFGGGAGGGAADAAIAGLPELSMPAGLLGTTSADAAIAGLPELSLPEIGAGLGGAATTAAELAPVGLAKGGMVYKSAINRRMFAKGGYASHDYRAGGKVPGKAQVQGNSLKNDTVPAMLSPKEIVIPRSITTGKDAPKKAAAFVAKVLAQKGLKK